MKFSVNHRITAESLGRTSAPRRVAEGWDYRLKRPKEVAVFLQGDVIEAELKEVAEFVGMKYGGFLKSASGAPLTPIGVKVSFVPPGSDVDLRKLTPKALVAHAYEFHRMILTADDREFHLQVGQIEERRTMDLAAYA